MTVDRTLSAPWDATTHDLLTKSLSHIARATVTDTTATDVPLELESGSVTFDDTRSPRAAATLVCRVPSDQALLDRIDGRIYGTRVTIDAGYLQPGAGEDVQPLVNLKLRGRGVARPDDTMTVEALGDESLIIDDGPTNGGSVTDTTVPAAMTKIIRLVFPGVAVDTTGTPVGSAVSQSPLGDKHTALTDLGDRVGAQAYDNGLGQWFIRPTVTVTGPAALALTVGVNGTVLRSSTQLTRDDEWFNAVQLTYEWRDLANVDQRIVSVRKVTSGPYAALLGNTRTMELRRDTPVTQAQADAAATAILTRAVTRGRSFTITAVSAYWLRPGHSVDVTLPLGETETHLVSSVRFDLRTGTMDVSTRLPDGVYTIGA